MPLFVRWPDTLNPGERNQVVQFIDLFPTLLDICKIDHQPKLPIDGVSLRDVLFDNGQLPQRRLFWQWNRGTPNYTHNAAVRDGSLKLVRPFVTRNIPRKNSTERAVLYDLSTEHQEARDVTAANSKQRDKLLKAVNEWARDVEQSRQR